MGDAEFSDVVVVGGGPAGLAAAWSAARAGRRVTLVDDNPQLGGQIWRGEHDHSASATAASWLDRVRSAGVRILSEARVFDRPSEGLMVAETPGGACRLEHRAAVLASGARERFLPFPGWTLPNVCGAGGLQALVKSGAPIRSKRVVVAGSGPLLLAAADYLRGRGADVRAIAEQAPKRKLARFGLALLADRRRLAQAVRLRRALAGIPYRAGCWPAEAVGAGELSGVTLEQAGRRWTLDCDYLACGFHLVPNTDLAELVGCDVGDGAVAVDAFQETSVAGVYCAGEATGVGGTELALVEGEIAGRAAAGLRDEAHRFFRARSRLRRFARLLDRTFAPREELKRLAQPDTLVCRCEDVPLGCLRGYDSWRAAKLETRCGMGPCQGRVCGPATKFLLGWGRESVRPPVFPVRVGSLTER